MVGSSYATAKAAILGALGGLTGITVLPEPPADALNLNEGSGKALWLSDAEGSYDNVVFCGANRLDLEERYTLKIVFQSLPVVPDDDTQAITDLRVDEMVGDFLLVLAADPTFGLLDTFAFFEAASGTWQRFGGPIPGTAIRPSRCELDLNVHARISFSP